MKAPPDIRTRLVAAGQCADEDFPLAETALDLAAVDRPGVKLEPYRRHLGEIAAETAAYVSGKRAVDLGQRIEALVQVIARRFGYSGTEDTFDDPDATNLTRVIDRRIGVPAALGVIYLTALRTLGWPAVGIDFPGRFMIRLEHGGERAMLDPFSGGDTVGPKELRDMLKGLSGKHAELSPADYQEMTDREVLMRLQGRVRSRLLRQDRMEEAAEVIETMLLFAPDTAHLWRECGFLHARLDNRRRAIAALEEFLKRGGTGDSRYNAARLLQELRQRLN